MSELNNTFGASANTTGVAQKNGISAGQFAASLVTAIVLFTVQVFIFLLIKDRFNRIYYPRTYLVPEKERTKAPAPGWWKWLKPVFTTPNSEFVQKCGLDAYFFLRYMRTLLKIFVPAALVIIPILIPLNSASGRGASWAVGSHANDSNVTGLDQLAWGNVAPTHTGRYWAHWLLAFGLICYVCYIAFDELRGYIRMRQAYMTSPQHRLRASATTVLVSSIPRKWCTVEALEGLFDVFPGGIRNIWVNRNFDELSAKVKKRDKLAQQLEAAETELIKKCFKKHEEKLKKEAKAAGKKASKDDQRRSAAIKDQQGQQNASGQGIHVGNPHQVQHSLSQAAGKHPISEESDSESTEVHEPEKPEKPTIPVPILGESIHAVGQGIEKISRGIFGGLRGVHDGINSSLDTNQGFTATTDRTQPQLAEEPQSYDRQSHDHGKLDSPTDFRASRESAETLTRPEQIRQSSVNAEKPATMIDRQPSKKEEPGKIKKTMMSLGLASDDPEPIDYPQPFEEDFQHDPDEAMWKKYLTEKDRDTSRLPIFGWEWMISLPLLGEKVDTIRYCRKEVARLNIEIEEDQANPERFPLMNSAFVQFNHQVAAHMACQSVAHHLPQQMAPRIVEIDPNDVIWDNMSVPWWQMYIRTAGVIAVVVGLIVLWAIPVAFTSALSQLETAAHTYPWLGWVLQIPAWFRSVLQGVLPAALLGLLMVLLPIVLRLLTTLQGMQSGTLVELQVQQYYFFFQFVQLFLIVTVASAITTFISYFTSADGILNIPSLLGQNIPKASNYFFSYMLLQALSVSAGALLQVGSLVGWFLLAPLLDNTARAKFKRQTSLSEIKWGTFFPVYTNLACIGLIYSVIAPLILVFNIITFSFFWFVYRYNSLFVNKFTRDTGGLLYPNAINYTFVGVYVMEIALIGMFFLVRDEENNVACAGQAIGMIVIAILTIIYQVLLNRAFSPLFRYLPITLEDDAVRRDEEFARALQQKQGLIENEDPNQDVEDQLEANERKEREADQLAEMAERERIASEKRSRSQQRLSQQQQDLEPYQFQNPEITLDEVDHQNRGIRLIRKAADKTGDVLSRPTLPRTSWADRNNVRNRRSSQYGTPRSQSREPGASIELDSFQKDQNRKKMSPLEVFGMIDKLHPTAGNEKDVEAQQAARTQMAEALFSGINDELEDLTAEQRDVLVARAFQHSALRARRPVIWLPRDELGVSDDEVKRMGRFSKNLWVSNVRQGLDHKGRCVYSGAPPDFSELDLITL